ncbi:MULTISPECIES: ArdC family protein [unclassified Bradyrhizobium]|uniref:ArdC family protein n=1 Tax=unclassified Bradyrhizobium TaxID=2631580 RepID=UPI002FF429A3
MANQLYANVTARILADLENGAAPWVKPWSATPGQNIPHNAATGRPYSGVNTVLLWLSHGRFASPRFLTFKQAQELGGHVRKGEHGFQVVFVKTCFSKPKGEEAETVDGKTYTVLRYYTVFNVDQCEGLPEKITNPAPIKSRNANERDATIEEFIAATGANYSETGGDRAFYSPSHDRVCMPTFESFKTAASYYATAFHELGHWTGAESRLDRTFGKRFGDRAYAAEELVAELTAAFLCAEFSIDGELRHSGYIGNWIALLKDDAKAFMTAASAAQKAADYLRSQALAAPLAIAA